MLRCIGFCGVLIGLLAFSGVWAEDPARRPAPEKPADSQQAGVKPSKPQPLNESGTVLLDVAGKRLLLKTKVVFRQGALELLCCLKQTKEHESILSLDAKAYVVHTGLLALKARTGTPAKYEPEFAPPTGQPLKITVSWTDDKGVLHRAPANSWIRHLTRRFFVQKFESLPAGLKIPEDSELRYDGKHKELAWFGPMSKDQKAALLALSDDKAYREAIESFYAQGISREMEANWVFVGSGFYVNPEGKKYYLAEDGDLISVANFPGATVDVSVRSSSDSGALLFEAWTDRIPPEGTEVTVELSPVFEAAGEKNAAPGK